MGKKKHDVNTEAVRGNSGQSVRGNNPQSGPVVGNSAQSGPAGNSAQSGPSVRRNLSIDRTSSGRINNRPQEEGVKVNLSDLLTGVLSISLNKVVDYVDDIVGHTFKEREVRFKEISKRHLDDIVDASNVYNGDLLVDRTTANGSLAIVPVVVLRLEDVSIATQQNRGGIVASLSATKNSGINSKYIEDALEKLVPAEGIISYTSEKTVTVYLNSRKVILDSIGLPYEKMANDYRLGVAYNQEWEGYTVSFQSKEIQL